jgi:hypothetical protein
MDADNVRSFLRAWEMADPSPTTRTLNGEVQPLKQEQVILGPGHADALTSIPGVDFTEALRRVQIMRFENIELPVLARSDLESTLRASDRPRDRERLELLRQLPR